MPQNYFTNLPAQAMQGGPYAPQQQEILRRQKMAQLLQQQAMQPIEAPPTPTGGFAAPISPLQVAAKVMQGYKGGQLEREGITRQQQLAEQMQTERQKALAAALQSSQAQPAQPMQMDAADNVQTPATPAMPADPARGLAALGQSKDPALLAQYAPIFNMQQAQQKQQTDLAAKAKEGELARQSREDLAREAAAARTETEEGRRADRLAAEKRSTELRREMETGRREDRAASEQSRKAERVGVRAEKFSAEQRGAKLKLDAVGDQYDRLKASAEELKDHPGLQRITGVMGSVPDYPGSDAANARARFETLKSQVALSVLQSIRDNSKTGGAVGQVSNFEQKMFQNNLAALANSQDYQSMKAALQQIIDFAEGSKKRMEGAYKSMYEPATGGSSEGWSIKPLP